MHTDRKEKLCGFGLIIKNVTDDGFFCYDHDRSPFVRIE
jgi:hypothetical protein